MTGVPVYLTGRSRLTITAINVPKMVNLATVFFRRHRVVASSRRRPEDPPVMDSLTIGSVGSKM
jgi:hypothetical protein